MEFSTCADWRIRLGTNMKVLRLNTTSRLIGSGHSDHPSSPIRNEVVYCKSLDNSVIWSKTAQTLRSCPQASRVTTHGQHVTSLGGGLTNLQWCSRRFLQSQSKGRQCFCCDFYIISSMYLSKVLLVGIQSLLSL